jgi:RNA polymerase sigma factor for flagellar operon FliA
MALTRSAWSPESFWILDVQPSRPASDPPDVLARFHAELDLVEINARQLARRLAAPQVTIDDLRSFGREGLLAASRTFDESRGVPFRRWANLRIRGAIVDGVRQWGNLPRRVYRELRALSAAESIRDEQEQEDATRPATTPEVADARLTHYLAGLATAMAMGTIAASPTGESEDAASRELSPEEATMFNELRETVRSVVAALPDSERTLVERHYFGGETLEQAAASIGLSKSWGSRLHARAIEAIARELRRLGVA